MIKKIFAAGLTVLGIACLAPAPVHAAGDMTFYKGKTIRVLIGYSAGGGYDAYARLVSRNMARYIPGNPTVVPQQMPGAGSLVAAGYLYHKAKRDGTVMATISQNAAISKILEPKRVKLDPGKLTWIGNANEGNNIIMMWHTAKVKSWKDLKKREYIIGGVGTRGTSVQYPRAMNNVLGTKFKIIHGFRGGSRINLAMERGEVEGQTQSWSSLRNGNPEWISGNKVNVFVQLSLKKHPDLPNVPLVFDFITKEQILPQFTVDEVKTYWRLMLTEKAMGRPFMLGPKVPADRVAAMRKAFTAMVSEKKFLAEAKKRRREIVFVSGGEIQKMIGSMAAAPKKTIENLASLIRYKGPIKRVKEALARHSGKVTKTKKGGRRIYLMFKGKEVKAKVSGSRTKVMLNGKKVKRKKIKAGMTCTFVYPGAGQEAKEVNCKK